MVKTMKLDCLLADSRANVTTEEGTVTSLVIVMRNRTRRTLEEMTSGANQQALILMESVTTARRKDTRSKIVSS